MVTYAQAKEFADDWINSGVPRSQQREVRVREFDLGFVCWAENAQGGEEPPADCIRMVIARNGGASTLWPPLPVNEVVRQFEETYGGAAEPNPAGAAKPVRGAVEATSFMLSPPQWFQDAGKAAIETEAAKLADAVDAVDAADRADPASAVQTTPPVSDRPAGQAPTLLGQEAHEEMHGAQPGGPLPFPPGPAAGYPFPPAPAGGPTPAQPFPFPPGPGGPGQAPPPQFPGAGQPGGPQFPGGGPVPPFPPAPAGGSMPGRPMPFPPGPAGGATPAQPASYIPTALPVPDAGPGPGSTPPGGVPFPPGADAPAPPFPPGPGGPGQQGGPTPAQPFPFPPGPGQAPMPQFPGAPQPGGPQFPGAPVPSFPPGPGGQGGQGVPPQFPGAPMPQFSPGPGGPGQPGGPQFPGAPGPGAPGGFPGANPPVFQPGPVPTGPVPPYSPGATPPGGVPFPPGPGGQGVPPQFPGGPGYGYPGAGSATAPPPAMAPPAAPAAQGAPSIGPGTVAVVSYRAPDGSEQKLIQRSEPGVPRPEFRAVQELRRLNVPPDQVLELHTDLELADLPGAYCAKVVRSAWPNVRISHTAAYGVGHQARQAGMAVLLDHLDQLHQLAAAPQRPRPVRVSLPPPGSVPPAPPVPPQELGAELGQAFGGAVYRFEQRAVSRPGIPQPVAETLMWAGLPLDFEPFFWIQARDGRPVPTLAELAAERGLQAGPDFGGYLVLGNDYGSQLCVQYGTAAVVAVDLDRPTVQPRFVNSGVPQFVRSLALLGRMWHFRHGLTPDQAGRWTADFQAQLPAIDPAALQHPDTWWSVLLEQFWDGLI